MRLLALLAAFSVAACASFGIPRRPTELECRDWIRASLSTPPACDRYAAQVAREMEAERLEDEKYEAQRERRKREDPVGYCQGIAKDDYKACRRDATDKAESAMARARQGAATRNAFGRPLVPEQPATDGITEVARMELETCEVEFRLAHAECGGATPPPRPSVPSAVEL